MIRLSVWIGVNFSDFNCDRCRKRKTAFCDKSKDIPGSQGPAPGPHWNAMPRSLLEDLGQPEGLKTCPLPMRPIWWPEVYIMYTHYENGHLPFPGGLFQQPATYSIIMASISAAKQRYEAERASNRAEKRKQEERMRQLQAQNRKG